MRCHQPVLQKRSCARFAESPWTPSRINRASKHRAARPRLVSHQQAAKPHESSFTAVSHCQDSLSAMECGHVLHDCCILNYCTTAQTTIDKLPCPTCRHIACPDIDVSSGDDGGQRRSFADALQFLQAPLELVGLQATSFVKKCGSAAVTIMACPQYNQSERTRLAHHLRQPVPWAAMIHGQAAHERQRRPSPRALPDEWQVRL